MNDALCAVPGADVHGERRRGRRREQGMDRMKQSPFWFQWLLVSMIAGLLTRATHPRTLLLTGFIFGLGQWIVLYSELRPRAGRAWLAHALWLPATVLSGLVGYLLIASLGVRILGPVLRALTSPYENNFSHLIFL